MNMEPRPRKILDCKLSGGKTPCLVTIIGHEEEVVPIAIHHAISHHGHKDTPELREALRATLRPETGEVR